MFKNIFGGGRKSIKTSVPLDAIAGLLESAVGKVEQGENQIAFRGWAGECVIAVEPVHAKTVNGNEVSELVTIRTDLAEDLSDFFSDQRIVVMNTMAALGALIKGGNAGRPIVGSRLSVFRGDDDAWNLYVPLIAFGALLHADSLLKAAVVAMGQQTGKLGLPGQDDPSRWTASDFEFVAKRLNQVGVFSNASSEGLTAEFPLEEGAVSAMMGHKTSLLTFHSNMAHPSLGNGLFFKLDIPLPLDEDELIYFANKLNQVEMELADSPPFFGAWCSHIENGLLSHVGFWPNLLYQPGTVLNIAVWMRMRSNQAKAFVSNHRHDPR